MSGPRGKPKIQMILSQKGKLTTVCCTTAESEAQEQGRTRATGTVDIDEDDQEINDSEKGRAFLKEKLLLMLEGAPLSLGSLSISLFQILAMPGLGHQAINAVRAYLLKEVEATEVAQAIREVTNEQFNKVTKDLKEFMEGLKEKVKEDLGEKTALLEKKMVELLEVVEKVAQQAGSAGGTPYRDALIWAVSGAPLDANPQLAAKESIRQRQSLINLPKGSRLRECTNTVLVGKFSEAMGKVTAQKHKIRSALNLQNGSILVDMIMDEGTAWLATKTNAEAFL